MKEKICIYCSANNLENATSDIFDKEMCIIFICSDRTLIPHQVGFQRIQPSSMTNEAVIRNGAEKVIDLHGHIVGIIIAITLSPLCCSLQVKSLCEFVAG